MDIFFEIHSDIPREGPGLTEATKTAFDIVYLDMVGTSKPPDGELRVLDIGCGPGMQTLDLVSHISSKVPVRITAIDTHQPFLETLSEKAKALNLDNMIEPINMSMFEIDLDKKSFDIVWSEGAIYIMGFEKGLASWKEYLKSDGYMLVSELSWLVNDPSNRIKEFWDNEYPAMMTTEENLKIIRDSGLEVVGHFVLPKAGWWDNYYTPLQERLNMLKVKYNGNTQALNAIEGTQMEIDMHNEYCESYGYVFYIIKNRI